MAETTIEWATHSWNPTRGCTKISPGCARCYAETFAERWRGIPGHAYEQGFDLRLVPEKLNEPLSWRKPRRIFVNSMSDLFHKDVPFDFIDHVFATMSLCPQHTFLVLTKRAERMHEYLATEGRRAFIEGRALRLAREIGKPITGKLLLWPMANVHIGVSVENQKAADERIPWLAQCPASFRFLSCEPLLEEVDLGLRTAACTCCPQWAGSRWLHLPRTVMADVPVGHMAGAISIPGFYRAHSNQHGAMSVQTPAGLLGIKPAEATALPPPDWIIVGGESGHGARPCRVDWVRSIVKQCKVAKTMCFVKQFGAHVIDRNDRGFLPDRDDTWPEDTEFGDSLDGMQYQGAPCRIHLRASKGQEMSEWPLDLRVRDLPQGAAMWQ